MVYPRVLQSSARESSSLTELFPVAVRAADLHERVDPKLLSDPEWLSICHCHERRIQDFAAGRLCARQALHELGIDGFSLLPGPDRQPLWPDSVVGSITHTVGYTAAVVAWSRDVRSLGVDSEQVGAVRPDLWPQICTPLELERLRQLEPGDGVTAAALLFVAKEAFFKCQFPLAREWLDFDAVTVRTADWLAGRGCFWITPMQPICLANCVPGADAAGKSWGGRFRRHGGYITAGMALPVTAAA